MAIPKEVLMGWLSGVCGGGRGKKGQRLSAEDLKKSIRESPLFKDVPEENITGMLLASRVVPVRASDAVVVEGGEGETYFIILEGKAAVHRRYCGDDEPKRVAELEPGQSFGEEALISNAKRNATVLMVTDGVLLSVPKHAFITYLMASLVTWLPPIEAQRRIDAGARWVDVRDDADSQDSCLPDAIFIPLRFLRERLHELDIKGEYICYCGTGRYSATAAFLMHQLGYKVGVLQGGLSGLESGT
jgi:rhodanese-related sulfurtransferase